VKRALRQCRAHPTRKRRAQETLRDDGIAAFIVCVYAALAEKERSLISRRSKETLAAAKGRGVVPGLRSPRIGAKIGNEAMAAAAARFAANMLPVIREIKAAGVHTHAGIAGALTARGVRTIRGARVWGASSVGGILRRVVAKEGTPR
jgi:DNA invertase Pin-like site-specific DNA recombinase